MKFNSTLAAALLMASGVVAAQAFAQTAPPLTPAQQRLQQLKAQRDAKIAQAKAQQNQIQRPVPTAAPTPTPIATPAPTPPPPPPPPPTAVPTTRPTAAPTTTPTAATAAPSASAAPKGSASGFTSTAAPSASAAPKPPAILGLDLEELKKTRPERRKVEIGSLQARWGELLRNDRATAELKQHAQRTAYLQRIRALASKANDAKTVQAVDILITKEDSRDADAMNALRSGALPTVAAGAGK
jgi:hypothetical protein